MNEKDGHLGVKLPTYANARRARILAFCLEVVVRLVDTSFSCTGFLMTTKYVSARLNTIQGSLQVFSTNSSLFGCLSLLGCLMIKYL